MLSSLLKSFVKFKKMNYDDLIKTRLHFRVIALLSCFHSRYWKLN